jgi:hypothetical protein
MKKILSICLIVCFMLSFAMPVMAADSENVALGANVTLVGYLEDAEDVKDVLVDGVYGTDELNYKAGNFNVKFAAFANRYNADGEMTTFDSYKEPPYAEGFPYYGMIILELKNAADVTTFRIIDSDPDYGIGDWRYQEFDILVSATGAAGSWKVAHEARGTRDNDSWVYVEEGDDLVCPYWIYEADLGANTGIKYVALGITMVCNHDNLGYGQWSNLYELEVFANGSSAPAATEPAATEPAATEPAATEPAATEPAATEPAATEPAATEPAATEPAATEPAGQPEAPATFDFVIVPVVAIAAAAAGAVVLKKKEN